MPIYEFKCKECGKVYDAIVPMGTTKDKCSCGKESEKSIGSFLFAAHGLPNGHNAVRVSKKAKGAE